MESVLVTISQQRQPPRPEWLRAPAPVGDNYRELKGLIERLRLHTVCESAACPNVGECWNHRTATFMILGNVCTRRCGFCAVQKGAPLPVDYDEPRRVAEAAAAMGLKYAVVTSVNRDDRKDGGAELFALTIRAIRERIPGCGVEVLIPDFQGSHAAMDMVLEAAPDVLNHNTETVPRLYRQVRLGARYERSLDILAYAKSARPEIPTKSGLMLGLGENRDEVLGVMRDLARARGRYPHTGPVPSPVAEAPASHPLRPARRVRRPAPPEYRDGIRARRIRPPGAQLLPRRGSGLNRDGRGCWRRSSTTLEFGFGFFQYFMHPNRQTVHDRIAETMPEGQVVVMQRDDSNPAGAMKSRPARRKSTSNAVARERKEASLRPSSALVRSPRAAS